MATTPDQLGGRKRDDSVPKHKITDVDPTVDDDNTDGWSELSFWVNTATPAVFVCVNPASGAADWRELTFK